jgi:ribosome-associated toxin RatA of RatAB toxin-antitoxin module
VIEVSRSVLVSFTPEQMYDLVEAVEDYPSFLPWCGGATVAHRDERITRATITIQYRGIRQNFTTENTKARPVEMLIRLVDGPFSRLDGSWRFTGLAGRGCKVELSLRYEFSSGILGKLLGPVFSHIADTMVDAFARRAERIYGSPASHG